MLAMFSPFHVTTWMANFNSIKLLGQSEHTVLGLDTMNFMIGVHR